jgi:8-oxo-dGTP diphosphatase
MAEQKVIDVVAGLIFKDGRLLACQRRAEGAFSLKWEFPGGKIEADEEPGAALVRELREELGVEAGGVEKVFTHTHTYAGFSTVRLQFFRVPAYRGQLVNRVFEQICWVGVDELAQLDFLDGDRPIVDWLVNGAGGALWHPLEF